MFLCSPGCWRRCTADAGEHRAPRAQQEQQQEEHCGRCECRRVARAGQEEGECEGVPEDGSYLWRGWRRRRGGCQCQPSTNMDTWGSAGPPPPADHHLCYPAHTHAQESTRSHTPKWRTSLPSHSSILTILLLLVVTLARFSGQFSSTQLFCMYAVSTHWYGHPFLFSLCLPFFHFSLSSTFASTT